LAWSTAGTVRFGLVAAELIDDQAGFPLVEVVRGAAAAGGLLDEGFQLGPDQLSQLGQRGQVLNPCCDGSVASTASRRLVGDALDDVSILVVMD
jgi:hypothetical protein